MKFPRMFSLTDLVVVAIMFWLIGFTTKINPAVGITAGVVMIVFIFRWEILEWVWSHFKMISKVIIHFLFAAGWTAVIFTGFWIFAFLWYIFVAPEGAPMGLILEHTRDYWWIILFIPLLFLRYTPTIKNSLWHDLITPER